MSQAKAKTLLNPALAAASVFVAAASAPAPAAAPTDVDTSQWECSQCPFTDDGKLASELEVGLGRNSDASAKFGEYSGLDGDGVHGIVGGSWRQSRSDGLAWRAEVSDLGLDTRSLAFSGGRQGSYRLSLRYDELPHNVFDTTATPFENVDSPLALPAGWLRTGNTRTMSTLGPSLALLKLRTERHTMAAALRNVFGANWSSYGSYRHETREGTLRQGAGFGFSAVELPRPVDFVTDNFDFGIRYTGAQLTARLGYEGSFFSDRQTDGALTWDNPYLGADQGRLALAPDNSAHQIGGTLNYRFGTRAALSASAAFGQLRQDDSLLPYSTDPTLGGALPRTRLDGKVDTTHLGATLVTNLDGIWSFLDSARVKIEGRYDKRDNKTAQSSWSYIVTDTFTSSSVTNLPYGFEQTRAGVSGDYDLRQLLRFLPGTQPVRLSGGWRHDDVKRTFQEGRDTSEDAGWGRVAWRPAHWLDLAVKWGGANREVDQYAPVAQIAAPQNPLLRKYYMADRERQFVDGTLTFAPIASLSFTATGHYANNDYVNSKLGLQASREHGYTTGINWAPEGSFSAWAQFGMEQSNARQAGSSNFGAANWYAKSQDRFQTGNAGFRIARIGKQLDLDVSAFFVNSTGTTALSGTGLSDALPQLHTRSNGGQIALAYTPRPALTVHAALRYEHYDDQDYALAGVAANTVPTLLSMGAKPWDYDVLLATLSFRYRFGAAAEEAAAAASEADKAESEEEKKD